MPFDLEVRRLAELLDNESCFRTVLGRDKIRERHRHLERGRQGFSEFEP